MSGLSASYGPVQALRRNRPDAVARRGRGGDGSQRRGQVDAARAPGRAARACRWCRSTIERRGCPTGCRPVTSCDTSRWYRRTPACCSTPRRSMPNAGPRTTTRRGRRQHASAPRTSLFPASARDAHPRDLSEGQRLGLALGRGAGGSATAAAARRAHTRPRLRGQAPVDRHPRRTRRTTVMPWSSPRTTSRSWRRWPIASW